MYNTYVTHRLPGTGAILNLMLVVKKLIFFFNNCKIKIVKQFITSATTCCVSQPQRVPKIDTFFSLPIQVSGTRVAVLDSYECKSVI